MSVLFFQDTLGSIYLCLLQKKSMKALLYILLIIVSAFFLFLFSIGANPILTLQSMSHSLQEVQAKPKEEPLPTPIATEEEIDDMAHRYFDNHVDMKWNKDQFDKGELTSEAARQTIRDCLDTFKKKEDCEHIINNLYWIGMPDVWAIKSVGNPDDVNQTVFSNFTQEQWIYGNPLYGATYLYFENGILKSYQKS
jgi:hypothetical protein